MLWTRIRTAVRRGPVLIGLASIFALVFVAACEDAEEFREARAYKIDSRSQLIGGPKALGTLGDYMLENDKIRVIVNGQPTDMTGGMPNKWGGAIIDAREAERIGLVNRVVPHEQLGEEVMALARTLAARPAGTLGLMKSMLYRALSMDLPAVLEMEALALSAAVKTEEHQAIVRGFLAERAARR